MTSPKTRSAQPTCMPQSGGQRQIKGDPPIVGEAKQILRGGTATQKEMLELAKKLKDEKKFGYARKILGRARSTRVADPDLRLELRQQHALCTYKDVDLPADSRLDLALEILQECDDLSTTTDQETLGLAGAIHKRRWEVDARKENLERSLSYYRRGYQQGPEGDQGYTGINTAFVLDLLASLEEREAEEAGSRSDTAEARRKEARQIRENLVVALPPLLERPKTSWLRKKWWFFATLAEAYFGLGCYDDRNYDEALRFLRDGQALPGVPEWEFQSTATQLSHLARLHSKDGTAVADFENSKAGQVIREFLGKKAAGAFNAYLGKVGLALSGGGFRASLFHMGVLAKLAELDVLRHVEVMSCVSGGSILGAHYYLEIKNLLQEKQDEEIDRTDYIKRVKRMERTFLAGVQKNIRTRIAAEFITNLKMIFLPGYSRTLRAGELYERWLYREVPDGNGRRPRWLTDLFITPKDHEGTFKPRNDNWHRKAKVPDLVLNATSLNTGHNWQFTASWMGEPPGSINTEVDGNYRLRRMYYREAPEQFRKIRLGHAVAASACVPGLFEPLSLKGLYPDITVRLVDGGVHDNQGIVALLQEDCKVLLVSDASGQMGTQDQPSAGVLGVPLRSNSILMSRVRNEEFDDLVTRVRSGLLRGLMFIHLKKDLDVDPVDWTDCEDPHEASDESRPASRRGPVTRYGLRKEVQGKLGDIRTDLDSFSEAEAFALMTSGYRMTGHAFATEPSLRHFPVYRGEPEEWRFLTLEEPMQRVAQSHKLMKQLDVGSQRAFKVWKLVTPLKVLAWVLAVAAVGGLTWVFWTYRATPILTVGAIGSALGGGVLAVFLGKTVMRIVEFRTTLLKIGIGIGLAILGPVLVRTHLSVFDKLYLHLGKARRLTD